MAGPAKKAGVATSKRPGGGAKSVASKPGGPSFRQAATKAAPKPASVTKAKAAPAPKTKTAPRQMAGGSSSSSAMAAAQARQKAMSSQISIPKGEKITPIGSPSKATPTRIAPATRVSPAPKAPTPRLAQSRPKGYSIPKQR